MTQTNCPNCGAVITGKKCEYCGTAFEVLIPEEHKERHQGSIVGIDAETFARRLTEVMAKCETPMKQITPYIPNDESPVNLKRQHFINDRILEPYQVLLPIQEVDSISDEEDEREWPILEPYESFNVSLIRTTKGKAFKKIRKQMIKDDRIKRRQARLLKLKNFFRR